jgi:two-component system response regulator AtoC
MTSVPQQDAAARPLPTRSQPEGGLHVLVVDDDPASRDRAHVFLAARGYEAVLFARTDEAVQSFRAARPMAVLLDISGPGSTDGLDVLNGLKKIDRDVPVIVLCGQGCTTTVVQAMKLGAADHISKPFDDSDLEKPVAAALRRHELSRQVATLRHELELEPDELLCGRSGPMAQVHESINRVADTDVTVLIRGESGTGKELVARALAASSPRRDKPFVKVNCAGLPTELLESELFGFERGAFTGAIQQKPGKLEFANQGTLFLDEVGDTPLAVQAKLLQLLQTGEFLRVGGKRDVRINVRIIAATSRDLERAVAEGTFREDLFCRLSTVSIALPPLRERRDDIAPLTEHLLKKYAVRFNKPHATIAPETMQLFMEYNWPGNIRELDNLAKRAVALDDDAAIRKEVAHGIAMARMQPPVARPAGGIHQPASNLAAVAAPRPAAAVPVPGDAADDSGHYSLKDISRSAARLAERELILKMLQQTRWNRKETAEMLGISYKALLYKIKENGLDKAS